MTSARHQPYTNEELAALILPWAETEMPEPYHQTLIASAKGADLYRKYLIRLVEVRATQDKAWRNQLPLVVLEETGLAVVVRHKPSGVLLTVAGRKVKDRKFGFSLLWGLTSDTVTAFLESDKQFDLTSATLVCPRCGSESVALTLQAAFSCADCGYDWE